MSGLIVTTSWEGGHPLDSHLADRLLAQALAATFYVAPEFGESRSGRRPDAGTVRELSRSFEIGSGALSNQPLTEMTARRARTEIADSRKVLADLTGTPVETFRYPRGVFGGRHIDMVAAAGYRYARTSRRFVTTRPADPLQAPTTVEASDLSLRRDFLGYVSAARVVGSSSAVRTGHWDDIATAVFDRCHVTGGVFHLWGSSSSLERRSEMDRLVRVFEHIARRPGVQYVVNGELGLPVEVPDIEASTVAGRYLRPAINTRRSGHAWVVGSREARRVN